MVFKLDPRVAMVWRDPFSLQFGIEPVRTVLREVTNAEERMIAALSLGVSRSGLSMIATAAGAGEPDVTRLLARLDPLLQSPEQPVAPRRVAIVGRGPTVDQLASALSTAGVSVSVSATVPLDECDFGVTIGHYVLDPESYGFWLRRDLPHLPVVFSDESVMVGPPVEPGHTACLYCLEHYRRDADASWAAIASQLWGRASGSETTLVSMEVAARVARGVIRRLDGTRPASATSVRIDARTGDATTRTWLPHPDCGCIGMAAPSTGSGTGVSAAQRESGSALGQGPPTIAAVAAARG
ncbi:MAG TPA: TOMM precursor leader peptide-binding protein [Galbitalea sp.]|jgi:bacteriocin biosynthesis cyclodehydratase domain-containing protein|nr:TOMM precursor leader peptide-binding protein [Galbitalea sp.]